MKINYEAVGGLIVFLIVVGFVALELAANLYILFGDVGK